MAGSFLLRKERSATTLANLLKYNPINLDYSSPFVLSPHNQVRVSGEFAKKVGGGGAGINANPVFGRKVERAANAVVTGFEFPDAVGLALERDNAVIVAIEKGEHMAVHVKHQHTRAVREVGKRHLLHHISAKRKTKVAICLNVEHSQK